MFASKKSKLLLGILFDLIGIASYIGGPFTALTDLIWAPVSYFLITKMYAGKAGVAAGIVSVIEELSPGLDVIPTFTLTWIYVYIIKPETTNQHLATKSQ